MTANVCFGLLLSYFIVGRAVGFDGDKVRVFQEGSEGNNLKVEVDEEEQLIATNAAIILEIFADPSRMGDAKSECII